MELIVEQRSRGVELKLSREATNERRTVVELERQIQPRDLTPERQQSIRDSLSSFAGKYVLVGSYVGDVEGYRLSRQLKAALKNMDVFDDGGYISGPIVEGMLVCGDNTALVQALSELLGAKIGSPIENPGYCVKDASVIVGMKPFEVLKE